MINYCQVLFTLQFYKSTILTVYRESSISGVCSPPVPMRGAPASNSLDDISTLSNMSPRKHFTGWYIT